jgi:bacterioferritin-associated ferredoxin
VIKEAPAICSDCKIAFESGYPAGQGWFDSCLMTGHHDMILDDAVALHVTSTRRIGRVLGCATKCPRCGQIVQVPNVENCSLAEAWRLAVKELRRLGRPNKSIFVSPAEPTKLMMEAWGHVLKRYGLAKTLTSAEAEEFAKLAWDAVSRLELTAARNREITSELERCMSASAIVEDPISTLAQSAKEVVPILREFVTRLPKSRAFGKVDVYQVITWFLAILGMLLHFLKRSPDDELGPAPNVEGKQESSEQLVPQSRTCALYVPEKDDNAGQDQATRDTDTEKANNQ